MDYTIQQSQHWNFHSLKKITDLEFMKQQTNHFLTETYQQFCE